MRRRIAGFAAAALGLALLGGIARAGEPGPASAPPSPAWVEWTPAAFARAKAERRLILVDVAAEWCHWCHVMDKTTYADARVRERVAKEYVAIRVDADARPDLAERWAEYHWPATIFLSPDAQQVLALRGYRDADALLAEFDRVRDAVHEGRTLVEPSRVDAGIAKDPQYADLVALRARLEDRLASLWDPVAAGWGRGQKYPHADALEHALREAQRTNDPAWRDQALRTLAAEENLIDPVWGGMYQYSEGGVWTQPHFEKVMSVQAGAIRNYALAYEVFRDERWLRDGKSVARILTTMFAAPEGGFYTSQDADLGAHGDAPFVDGHQYFTLDDAGRRRLGIPRIDRAIYAQENGWAIEALSRLSSSVADAVGALWRLSGQFDNGAGAFRHSEGDRGAFHLGDQVAMATARLELSSRMKRGKEREAFIGVAVRTGEALESVFLDRANGGFFATTEDPAAAGAFRERVKSLDGNAEAARFLVRLAQETGDAHWRALALRAMASVSGSDAIERAGPRCASLLLAVEDVLFEPQAAPRGR